MSDMDVKTKSEDENLEVEIKKSDDENLEVDEFLEN